MREDHITRWVKRNGRRLDPPLRASGFSPLWASTEDPPSLWSTCQRCGVAVRLTREAPEPDYLREHWARHHRFKAHVLSPLASGYNRWRRSKGKRGAA